MSRSYLNLARDPFVNSRPVVRLSIFLWVVGALLLAGNVWLYWDFLAGRGDTYARLAQVEREIRETQQRISTLDAELVELDLAEQNRQVEFLNDRIGRRLFSWSELFDELGEILPHDVQLTRLQPESGDEDGPSRGRSSTRGEDLEEGQVLLRIDAQARDDASILATVDSLFEGSAFERPNLTQQVREEGGLIRFNLETVYEPTRRPVEPDPDPVESADAADSESDGEEDGDGLANEEPKPSQRPARPARIGTPASSPPEVR